jgi:hypothetical protein
MLHPGLSPLNEDVAVARRGLSKLAALEFEVACFAHGRALRNGASRAFGELVRRLESTDARGPAAGDG